MSEIRIQQIDFERAPGGIDIVEGNPEDLHGLHAPVIDYEELYKRYEQGNDTYDVLKSEMGLNYEIAIFNPEKLDTARIVKPSTSFSSLYKNPGNAIEIALAAAANPGAAYIYVASFGNHPTGHMTPNDRISFARNGRYTSGNGLPETPYRPLASVQDMAQTLQENNLAPTHFSADVEAGRLALGLMTALEEDSIKGTYLNGIDGISRGASYVRAKLSEDLKSRIRRRGIEESGPGEVTPVNIKEVKRKMPNIYNGLGRIAHLAPLPVILFPGDTRDKIYSTIGCRGNDDLGDLEKHAVFNDMRAAITRHDAPITLQFNRESAIHSVDDCIRFGRLLMESIPEGEWSDQRRVRILIGEGTLDAHTEAPHGHARTERHVFPDIRHQMRAIGGLLDSEVFSLQPVSRAA